MRSRVRLFVKTPSVTGTHNKYCVDFYDIDSIHSHYKGNYNKRGGAAEGRATSFVVAANGRQSVVAMNRVDVVTANTTLVLRLSKTGRTVDRTAYGLDWMDGRAVLSQIECW